MRVLGIFCCVFIAFGANNARAQSEGFDPRQPCGDILRGASDTDKMMVAAWTFGYLAGDRNDVRPVDLENNKVVLRNLINVCVKDETRTLFDLLQLHNPGGAEDAGSAAHAKVLLQRFVEPGADLVALTAALAGRAA